MYIHIGRGAECWVVHLANEDRKDNWVILKAFKEFDKAVAFALALKEMRVHIDSEARFEARLEQAIGDI